MVYIFNNIFNKANTSNITNIPAIYFNISFEKKSGDHTNAISITVPNNTNKVSVIFESMHIYKTKRFIKRFINFYKHVYKYG